jgi:3-dehydroquinate synthase
MTMNYLIVNLPPNEDNSYKIFYNVNIYDHLLDSLANIVTNHQIVIITDSNVAKYYLASLVLLLQKHGYQVLPLIIKAGESSKTAKTKQYLESQMFEHNINRSALLIALGGGVVGDISGYIASTYMRGINYIQIPTSLLAMIDSSIGGKTGINNKYGKNLIGSFYQPKLVLIDNNFLTTLPRKHIKNGIIEAIKIFLTFDKEYFYYIYDNIHQIYSNIDLINKIIIRAVELKKQIVELDQKDNNIRASLNFGHTIGHAIEQVSHYKILHGYAVGIGIIIEATIAHKLQKLNKKELDIIYDLIVNKLKIDIKILQKYDIQAIINAMYRDKKTNHNAINFILLQSIGKIANSSDTSIVTSVSEVIIREGLDQSQTVQY